MRLSLGLNVANVSAGGYAGPASQEIAQELTASTTKWTLIEVANSRRVAKSPTVDYGGGDPCYIGDGYFAVGTGAAGTGALRLENTAGAYNRNSDNLRAFERSSANTLFVGDPCLATRRSTTRSREVLA